MATATLTPTPTLIRASPNPNRLWTRLGLLLTSMVLSSVVDHVFRGFTSGELGLTLATALGAPPELLLSLVGEGSGIGVLDGEAGGVDAAAAPRRIMAPVADAANPHSHSQGLMDLRSQVRVGFGLGLG